MEKATMTTAEARRSKNETKTLNRIEQDLASARVGGRFEDALHYLDEVFVLHKHTESAAVKAHCAALLAAPETLQKAA
jgi:hypothetical protein